VIVTLKSTAFFLLLGCCLLCGGCVGPHYTNHQLVIFGKAAPTIAGLDIPAIQKNLSVTPVPKVSLVTMLTDFSTIPLKCMGVQGWKDYHLYAKACGTVVQHQLSSDRILTVDLRLNSLEVSGTSIPQSDGKFIRAEIYRGKVPVDKTMFAQKDAVMIVKGKLVWDTDGWFEIHPQGRGDVRFDSKPDASQAETAAESDALLTAILDKAFKCEL
jgi:hypothetical protein